MKENRRRREGESMSEEWLIGSVSSVWHYRKSCEVRGELDRKSERERERENKEEGR